METVLLPLLDGEDKSSSLKNCIRNRYRHLRKWAQRTCTDSFRVYDRDIKEFPASIDYYAGDFCIQYFSFDRSTNEIPKKLSEGVHTALQELFGIKTDHMFEKTRIRRLAQDQYEKVSDVQAVRLVREYGVTFKVNLSDYLDTGLFLDHRETRQMVARMTVGKRLLNLFSYTGAFSVQAAFAGSAFTKSVDLSNTYTAWAEENFSLNGLSLEKNVVIRADCLRFLDAEIASGRRYDTIVIDPPTISRSKKMVDMFDIQKDYVPLLLKTFALLAPQGSVVFSTNSRNFTFEKEYFAPYVVKDLSTKTIPQDFHNQKIHQCYIVSA